MELKDMILSTLAELDIEEEGEKEQVTQEKPKVKIRDELPQVDKPKEEPVKEEAIEVVDEDEDPSKDEEAFLSNVRERVLVLFEGFQSPNNKKLDAKVDLTLNFLEYLLATIEERMEKIKS